MEIDEQIKVITMNTMQQHIAKITARRTLDLVRIINSLNECLFCALHTAEKFPRIREKTLFSDKFETEDEKINEYNKRIRIKSEESLEGELTSLQFYLKSNKTDVNDIVLPHIENVISIEDITSRCKKIEELNRRLKECMTDFKKCNIVLCVMDNKMKL